jgi:hypothetical protein
MLKGLGCFKFSPSGFCIVAVCHGREQGQDFYAVVAIDPENYKYFKKRYVPGEMSSFRTFGHELVRGWGTEPDQAVLDQLAKRHEIGFGVSDSFLTQFATNMESVMSPMRNRPSAFVSSSSAWG